MHPESKVREVEVVHDGIAHTATYFVERGIIIAKLGDQVMRVPVGFVDPSKTVRALLTAKIERAARLSKHRDEWTSATGKVSSRRRGRPRLAPLEPEN